jgi:hypothetical protein
MNLFMPTLALIVLTCNVIAFLVFQVLGLFFHAQDSLVWLLPLGLLQCGIGIPYGLLIGADDDCPQWMRWFAWTHVAAAPLMLATGIGAALLLGIAA